MALAGRAAFSPGITGGNAVLKRLMFFAYGVVCVPDLPRHVPLRDRVRRRLRRAHAASTARAQTLAGRQRWRSTPRCSTIFAVQHSVMARRWFKERWTQIVPWTIERSTYVLCASLALLLLFWQWRPIGIQIWSIENAAARAVLWTLFAAGWATVLVVTFLINHFDLFGLRQVWLPLIGRPYTRVSFRTPLPYRFVRHPLYFGFLLAFWMTPTMTLAHLVFAAGHDRLHRAGDPVRGTRLVAEHGAAYEDYRRRVPMLLPGAARARPCHACRRRGCCRSLASCEHVASSVPSSSWPARRATTRAAAAKTQSSELVRVVRDATERFRDPAVAEARATSCVRLRQRARLRRDGSPLRQPGSSSATRRSIRGVPRS